MSHLTRRAGAVRRTAAAVAAVALLTTGAVTAWPGSAAPSAADEIDDARARAAALATRLERLQVKLETATEDRAAAEDALDGAAGVELAGARAVAAAQDALIAEATGVEQTVRALYMSGGPSALYASVLEGTSLTDIAIRARAVEHLLDVRMAGVSEAARLRDRAQRMQRVREGMTTDRLVLAAQAREAEERAADLTRRIEQARQDADAEVVRLVEEEQARIEAARKAAAEAALAAAGQVPWGGVRVPDDQYVAMDAAIGVANRKPATGWAERALIDARQWLGTPYSAGGGGPNGPGTGWCSSSAPDDGRGDSGECLATSTRGFDCSSFVQRVYSAAGLMLPRTSRQQWWAGTEVAMSDLEPGDLLFWAYDTGNPASIHHVAVYLGAGLMVHSPHTGDHVRVAAVYTNGLIGAVRPG